MATELAVQAQQYTKAVEIPKQYQQFVKVFSKEESQRFPPTCIWDHMINMLPGASPALDCKVYPLNQEHYKSLQGWLDEQLAKGYIRPSKSPYTSSFFFVGKKDGK